MNETFVKSKRHTDSNRICMTERERERGRQRDQRQSKRQRVREWDRETEGDTIIDFYQNDVIYYIYFICATLRA